MAIRLGALALVAAASTIAVPAAAAGPDSVRVARASVVVQQAGADALAGTTKAKASPAASPVALAEDAVQKSAMTVAKASPATDASERPEPPRPTCRVGEGCSYRTLLGYLVITKDLEIPGAPVMALRLIPTHSSLAGGATSPIVLKPRVVGTAWSGLEIAAKF
jgi:hypothetical protein